MQKGITPMTTSPQAAIEIQIWPIDRLVDSAWRNRAGLNGCGPAAASDRRGKRSVTVEFSKDLRGKTRDIWGCLRIGRNGPSLICAGGARTSSRITRPPQQ
jgi:hypothetical protein